MKRLIPLTLMLLLSAGTALAQGVQTGAIRGMVQDQQDRTVPGATVSVTSPALLGPRSTVTDGLGNYSLTALPPGTYEVTFELSGFATIAVMTTVPLGLTVEQDATMRAAGVTETVQVVADAPVPITTPVVGMNFRQPEIELLATPRSLQGIAQLAPAVTENSPNANQVVINGAFAFDSAFLVNGIDVNDNILAQPQSLFIEDAIEETQVLTSGISAEYGRFSGGVINAITKSGGNTFSGSGRINFQNPSWTTATPFESSRPVPVVHTDDLQQIYEGTFGGPLMKERLWFFTAGRYAALETPRTLSLTGVQVVQNDKSRRGEIKLTGAVRPGHILQGGYLNNPRTTTNSSGAFSLVIDPNALSTISTPNRAYHGNYRGVLRDDLLFEAQLSGRYNELIGGGTGTNLATDSPFVGTCFCTIYNAPYFDGVDAEQRNNRQFTASATNFWKRGGSHETKGGYEWYRSQRTGGGSQSPTQYVFAANFLTAGGAPVLDATGRPTPVFVPGVSRLTYFPAITGAVLNNDSNSLYLADHWVINSRVSADLGARFEHVKAVSTGDLVSINNYRIVPRAAVAFDATGDGDQIVHVTYGQYSGRYNEAQIGRNSPVGNSPSIDSVYQGPAGQGYSFASGLDPANYPIAPGTAVSDATQNVFMTPGTKSPLTHELSLSYGANLFDGRGYAEVTYVARTTRNLLDDVQDRTTGTTNVNVNGVSAGTFTNIVFANTAAAHRQYQGLVFQSRYRIRANFSVNGHYTLQLENHGNYEGEGTNAPGNKSFIGDYPEAFSAERNFPDGRLQGFQRSRLRLWSIYNWNMGAAGDLSVSGLLRVDSGRVYSLAARNQALTATQIALISAAGYPDRPSTSGNMVFFNGERGSETFPGYGLFDTSINYNIPVFSTLRPWVKFDVYNLFNNQKLIGWNTTVTQTASSAKDSLGLATGYTPGATTGTATGNTVTNLYTSTINAYPVAFGGAPAGGRTFRVSMGFRF